MGWEQWLLLVWISARLSLSPITSSQINYSSKGQINSQWGDWKPAELPPQGAAICDMKTRWRQVTRGAPQEMILYPGPLSIFMNGLGGGAVWTLSKRAEYTNLWVMVATPAACVAVQGDLDRQKKWANKFKKGKCKILHLGRKKPHAPGHAGG